MDLDKLSIKLCKKIDTFQHISLKKQNEKLLNSKTCLINLRETSKFNLIEKLNFLKLNISKLMVKKNLSDKSITSTKNMTVKKHRLNTPETLAENDLGIKEMIGYLNGPFGNLTLDNISIPNPSVKIIDLSNHLKSACGITEIYNNSRYSLALTDFELSSLNFIENYDSFLGKEIQLTYLKKIKEIKFKNYYAICTNTLSLLYVCDMELHRILIFDLKSYRLKRIICGLGINGEGSRKLEFNCPRDICFYKGKLYVLDQGADSVDIFTENGDFIKSFMFNEKPQLQIENAWSVRVTENLMVIVDWKTKILMYDLAGQLKEIIECLGVLSICFVGSRNLYVHSENGDFICYSLLINEFQVIKPFEVYRRNLKNLKHKSEFMIFASNQKFILSLGWKKALALIEF